MAAGWLFPWPRGCAGTTGQGSSAYEGAFLCAQPSPLWALWLPGSEEPAGSLAFPSGRRPDAPRTGKAVGGSPRWLPSEESLLALPTVWCFENRRPYALSLWEAVTPWAGAARTLSSLSLPRNSDAAVAGCAVSVVQCRGSPVPELVVTPRNPWHREVRAPPSPLPSSWHPPPACRFRAACSTSRCFLWEEPRVTVCICLCSWMSWVQ